MHTPGQSMALSKESTAAMTRKPILILSLAFTLRIILFNIPTIANTLATRVEVVTPITSFKRCKWIQQSFFAFSVCGMGIREK
jgi:hypothetical protein